MGKKYKKSPIVEFFCFKLQNIAKKKFTGRSSKRMNYLIGEIVDISLSSMDSTSYLWQTCDTIPFIILIILSCSSLSFNCLSLSLSLLLVGDIRNAIPTTRTEHTIVAIINFTPSKSFRLDITRTDRQIR